MPTSGSVIITTTAQELINDAARNLTVLAIGQTLRADHNNYMLRALNRIVAQIGPFDFGASGDEWTRREATLFLQSGQATYALGNTGDFATDGPYYERTVLAADDPRITLDSIVNANGADYIAVEKNTGEWLFTTILGVEGGNVLVIDNNFGVSIDVGARVVYFTHKMRRPEQITALNRRDKNGVETPIAPMLRDPYAAIPNKAAAGDPCQYYAEAQIDNSRISTWPVPENIDSTLRIYYLSPVETFLTFPDNPDFPIQWQRPLMWSLVKECAPYFKRPFTQEMQANFDTSMQIAQHVQPEVVDVCFEPGRY